MLFLASARSAFFGRTHGEFSYNVIDLRAIYDGGLLKSIRIDPFAAYVYGDEFDLRAVALFGTENVALDYGERTVAALNRVVRSDDVVTLSPAQLSRLTPGYETVWVGDVDGNGLLTILDLQSFKVLIAGADGAVRFEVCDCNADGLVTISDLAELKLILAGSREAREGSAPLSSVRVDQSLACAGVTKLGGTGALMVDVSDKDIPADELSSVSAIVMAPAHSVFTFTLGGASVSAAAEQDSAALVKADIEGASGDIDSVLIEFDADSFSLIALIFSYK